MPSPPFDWTPLKLQILLHHYVSPQLYVPDSDAAGEALTSLVQADLLKIRDYTTCYWEPTPKGRAHVEALLRVQPPEHREQWVTRWTPDPIVAAGSTFAATLRGRAEDFTETLLDKARRAEFDRGLDGED